MRFMLTMICALARVGGMALLEHPAFPFGLLPRDLARFGAARLCDGSNGFTVLK